MRTNLFGRATVWMAALALLPAGCSFAFVDGPPTTHKQLPYFECTSSNILPTVDAVFAGIWAVSAVGTLVSAYSRSSSDPYSTADNDKGDAILIGALALAIGASAVYGYQKTSTCREAKEQLIVRLGNGPGFAAPRPAAPPVDPWLNPPPSSFAAPPPAAAPPAPTPPRPPRRRPPPPPRVLPKTTRCPSHEDPPAR